MLIKVLSQTFSFQSVSKNFACASGQPAPETQSLFLHPSVFVWMSYTNCGSLPFYCIRLHGRQHPVHKTHGALSHARQHFATSFRDGNRVPQAQKENIIITPINISVTFAYKYAALYGRVCEQTQHVLIPKKLLASKQKGGGGNKCLLLCVRGAAFFPLLCARLMPPRPTPPAALRKQMEVVIKRAACMMGIFSRVTDFLVTLRWWLVEN